MNAIQEISDNIQVATLYRADMRRATDEINAVHEDTEAIIHSAVSSMGDITQDDSETMARTLLRVYTILAEEPTPKGIRRAKMRIRSLFEEMRQT